MNYKWCCIGFIAILLAIFTEYSFGQINANDQAFRVAPRTQFQCGKRPSGYYADIDAGCQVYHMCDGLGRQFSYSCPNTTLFQQRMLICDHWYMVNCSDSESNYDANLLIGQRDKPFVRDDEHELRTPRPDLLDRPYAPDYAGESYRNIYKNSPAQQNALNDPNSKADNFAKRARAPIEQLKPFSVPPYWNHVQQRASQPKFAALRRRDETPDNHNDLKVASSQDSRRSENEDHSATEKPISKPSREYTPPFLFPKYNGNYTATVAMPTSTIKPTISNIIINVPDLPKQPQQNEVDFPNHHQTDIKIELNNLIKNADTNNNIIQGRILNHPNSISASTISANHQPENITPSSIDSNDLLPVVTSNIIPLPASGLLPPFDTFSTHDDSTTQGPPIYFEWKIPASGLEPPKLEEIKPKVSADESDNQIPVLPPTEKPKPSINIPILEKELVPPIYDTNRLTLTKIRVPAIGLEPPKLVQPIISNDTNNIVQNHSFPSLAPIHAAIHNFTSDTDQNKSQTPRSISSSSSHTSSPNDLFSTTNSGATTKENNYLDLQKMFLIPSYTFPLETEQRPGYDRDNAVNSFQIKIPDSATSASGTHWYGENAECPDCHPSFLKPGTCEPCIKFR